MTLTCKTQQRPQKPDVQLEFCFFRDSQALGLGWSSSPELQIATMWREDSGSYWCEEKIVTLKDTRSWSRSRRVPISVQSECRGPSVWWGVGGGQEGRARGWWSGRAFWASVLIRVPHPFAKPNRAERKAFRKSLLRVLTVLETGREGTGRNRCMVHGSELEGADAQPAP